MKFRLGELFCGPGGMSLGAITSSIQSKDGSLWEIKHEWASDYDADSCETFRKNIGGSDESVIHKDVRELNVDDLKEIDCFAYGFPCNDFSLVGEQKGFNGEFGPLYTYGLKVINRFNPIFFVAENVSGLSSANEGNAFKEILNDLEKSGRNGYNLTAHKYKSELYGIPQTRHRIIIVGIRKDLKKNFKVPMPTTPNPEDYVDVKSALENPPIGNAQNNELTKQSPIVVERLGHIKPGENVWNATLPEHLQLNVKGAKLSQIYRRLHPDKPSYTITGSGGGGTHVYHWHEPRALTNRERARIQTFPDNFVFKGSKESVRKQIGMAVPPKLSHTIFEAILKTLAEVEYPNIDSNIQ
jgi:DNA (cytosine-5)-methyltransferase 1